MSGPSKQEFIKAIRDINNPKLNKKRNFVEKVELNFSLKSINFKKQKKNIWWNQTTLWSEKIS